MAWPPWRGRRAPPAPSCTCPSDVVFFGDLERSLREDDVLAPLTPHGERKAAVTAACPGALLVRTSLIYGDVEPSTYERAALDPAPTFLADELRCPVAACDLWRRSPSRRRCPLSAAAATSPARRPSGGWAICSDWRRWCRSA